MRPGRGDAGALREGPACRRCVGAGRGPPAWSHVHATAATSARTCRVPLAFTGCLLHGGAQVGDGNINFVFIVEGPAGGICVKQALPYVRCVGESWPLTQVRRAPSRALALHA